jgi:MtaA/CmuA family methyltransferase
MTEFTPKQRLLSVLHREPVDRPPFVCPGGMMNMAITDVMDAVGESWPEAHSDARSMALLALGMHEVAGVENLGAPFCMTIEAEAMGSTVGLGTRQTEPRVDAYALDNLNELDRLTTLDTSQGRAAVAVEAMRLMSQSHPEVPLIADLTGPVSLATSVIDPLVFYRAMRLDKPAARALLELSTDAAIALGDAAVAAGADVICIADPSATGDLIGGKAFAEFALPYVNEMVDHFAERGVPSIVHICGNVQTLGESLRGVSAPVISIDSIVAIRTLQELAPDHLTMGNVSTYLLEYGSPENLAKVAENCVALGVDIAAPACGIGARTPLANVRAVADAVAGTAKK